MRLGFRQFLIFLLFAYCSAPFAMEQITVQLKWFNQFQFAGYYAAIEKGYYAEEGLHVILRERDPTHDPVTDVLEGRADYGITDTGLVLAAQKEYPVVLLAQIFQHSPLILITRKDSGIRTPYELLQKRITTNVKGITDTPILAMLYNTLGGLDKAIIQPYSFRSEDLIESKTDAYAGYVTDQPYYFRQKGVPVNIIDPRDYGVDFYGDNLFTTKQELRTHPQRVIRMLRATLKGWRYAMDHPDEMIDLILEKFNTQNLTRAHLQYEARETRKIIVPDFVELGSYQPSRYQKIAQIYAALKLSSTYEVPKGFLLHEWISKLDLNNEETEAIKGHLAGLNLFTKSSTPRVDLSDEENANISALPPIRVGIIDAEPPLSFVKDGEIRGYLNEVLRRAADSIGIELDYVTGFTYADSLKALERGEVDLLTDYSSFGAEREYALQTQSVQTSPFVAVGRINAPPVRGINDLIQKKVASVTGYQQTITLQERFPQIEIVQVKNIIDGYRALRSGDADYYIDNATHAGYYLNHHLISDLQIAGELPINEMGKLSLHFAIGQQHPLLYSAMRKALDSISADEYTELRIKWQAQFPSSSGLVLTDEERSWLQEHPVIRVATDPGWAPVEFKTTDGRTEGISIDYLDKMARLLGVKFEILDLDNWQEAVTAMKTRQADMYSSVARTPEREAYTVFTKPYVSMPIGIYARDDISYLGNVANLAGKRVAVAEGYAIEEWLKNDYPELNLVAVPAPGEGLLLVSEGEVDAFVGNIVTASYYIGKLQLGNVRYAGDTSYANNQAMAVRNDWPILAGILQKALDVIPKNERESIFNHWMSIHFERSVDYHLVLWTVVVASILIIGIAIWNRLLNRMVRIRTEHLQESEARFRSFFERNSSVMLLINPDTGDIKGANKAASAFYGYSRDQFMTMTIADINTLPPGEVAAERQRAYDEERSYFNFVHRLADGKLRHVEVYSTPIKSSGEGLLFSIVHDITDRKQAEEKIFHQAHYDALTNIPNRFLILDRLSQLILDAARRDIKVGVLFMDIDDFKKINDTMGHDTGDRLLVELSKRLSHCLREGDTLGRLGGDEFLMLVGNLKDTNDVAPIAQKLLDNTKTPISFDGRELVLTSSIGIAIYPDDGQSAVELMRKADSAMYHSKEHGRNTYSYFTESMNQSVSRRLAIEQQLHGAVEREEFYLCYQPKVDVQSRRIIGAEALLRWRNPELGEVAPFEFIPIAEQTGLIVPIGEFVLSRSTQMLAKIQNSHSRHLNMAINLSPRQFREANLLGVIRKIVEEAGVSWSSLEFEITEGVLMTGLKNINIALNELNHAGASIAMDDFGTGYSSLSYLRSYPFDVLKIDRSFIMDITIDRQDLELVSAAIVMSRSLGLKVVAEGVETEEQLQILASLGCDIAQGYLFSKPVSEQEFIRQLDNEK